MEIEAKDMGVQPDYPNHNGDLIEYVIRRPSDSEPVMRVTYRRGKEPCLFIEKLVSNKPPLANYLVWGWSELKDGEAVSEQKPMLESAAIRAELFELITEWLGPSVENIPYFQEKRDKILKGEK